MGEWFVMSKLKKFLAAICAVSLILSVPSVSLAGYDEMMEELNKKAATGRADIEKRYTEQERFFEIKKNDLRIVEGEIENWQKQIDDLIKQHEKHKTDEEYASEIDVMKETLLDEKENLETCREVLDGLTVFLTSDQNEKDDGLIQSRDIAQKNYDDAFKRVDELEKQFAELNISQGKAKNFESNLKKLNEEKLKSENERDMLKKDVEKCKLRHDELLAEKLNFEEEINHAKFMINYCNDQNKKNFEKWNIILAGDQGKDNVLDGQNIGQTCGVFASTNAINYFNCIKDNKQPIQGFGNVINHFLSHGGKKEVLNNVLSAEELIEYLKNNNINTYALAYEESVDNTSKSEIEFNKQINNVEEFLLAHFQSKNPSPVLNLNNGHWQAFVAYDAINNKLLLVDSAPAKVEWVDLLVAAKNSVSILGNRLNWQWLFLARDKQSDSDFFGADLDRSLTNEMKQQIINKLSKDF